MKKGLLHLQQSFFYAGRGILPVFHFGYGAIFLQKLIHIQILREMFSLCG